MRARDVCLPRSVIERYDVHPGWERVPWCIWDSQIVSRNAVFFKVPMGDGGKEYGDTNMCLSHLLPRDQEFLVTQIGWTGISSRTRGNISLHIGNKVYFDAPLALGSIETWRTFSPSDILITFEQYFSVVVHRGGEPKKPVHMCISLNGVMFRRVQ